MVNHHRIMSHVVSNHSLTHSSRIYGGNIERISILAECLQHGTLEPQALAAARIAQLKGGRRNGRVTQMLYLSLILDIRTNKYIIQQMDVRKNRNYNKAHSNNTLSLPITFQTQLALLLALCNLSTRIPQSESITSPDLATKFDHFIFH